VTAGSVDERIVAIAERKLVLDAAILTDGGGKVNPITLPS
jgi:hypothetical protein